MNHALKMIIGCVVPIALIFLLPVLGVSQGATLTVFLVLMLACHLTMMHGYGHHRSGPPKKEAKQHGPS